MRARKGGVGFTGPGAGERSGGRGRGIEGRGKMEGGEGMYWNQGPKLQVRGWYYMMVAREGFLSACPRDRSFARG